MDNWKIVNEPIRIPINYLQLAQGAGMIVFCNVRLVLVLLLIS